MEFIQQVRQTTVITGPGSHDRDLANAILETGWLTLSIATWPYIKVDCYKGEAVNSLSYSLKYTYYMQYLIWALWRRLPYFGTYDIPKNFIFPLLGRIAERQLREFDTLITWPQVGLESILRAKREGKRVLLEHPMAHVDEWVENARLEQELWGEKGKGINSLWPRSLVRRAKAEYENADYINVLSSYAKDSFIKSGVNAAKILVTPLGIDSEAISKGNRSTVKDNLVVLYVGRLELLKGVQYLISAFKQIKKRNVELWLVGPVLPELKGLMRRLQADNIKVFGSVPKENLSPFYERADVFVFPSVCDAFGLVLLEAMAHSLPVITTNNSAGDDLIESGVDGFVVQCRQVDQIICRLNQLLDEPELRISMGSKARAKVEESYSPTSYTNALKATLEAVLKNG